MIGLPRGKMSFELVHPENGHALAVLDLAWPNGLQVGLSEPVAVLLNEGLELLKIVNQQGYRYFTEVEAFKAYVETRPMPTIAPQSGVGAEAQQ